MIVDRLRWTIKGQKGFTLVEIITALAITSLISVGAATATVQVLNQSARNSDYVTASRHTMNAIHWISRDSQMSQTVEPTGVSGFPLMLSWIEWDNSEHQVTYYIEDKKLKRSYSVDGGVPVETVVAQNINPLPENTTCEYAGGVLTLKITTTIGEGAHALSVTRVREITPRPGL